MNYTLDARGESENRRMEVFARSHELRLKLRSTYRELDRELAALMAEARAANLTGQTESAA